MGDAGTVGVAWPDPAGDAGEAVAPLHQLEAEQVVEGGGMGVERLGGHGCPVPVAGAAVKPAVAVGGAAPHLRRMQPIPERVDIEASGDVALPAEIAARLLGAPLPAFLADLRAGAVHSVVERGEGEDAGRLRLTLLRRATRRVLVVEAATGRVLDAR
jgi:hypothetical protein